MILPLAVTLAAVVAVPAAPPETAPLADCRAGTDLGRLPAVMREAAADMHDAALRLAAFANTTGDPILKDLAVALTGEGHEAVMDGADHLEDLAAALRLACDELDAADRQIAAWGRLIASSDRLIASQGQRLTDWQDYADKATAVVERQARRRKWEALARLIEGFAFGYGARALTD